MKDNIIFRKIWQDDDVIELTVECSSPIITATSEVSFRFFREDALGHIAIEVFAELDDGGDYSKHNCCFFVRTEYGLLMNFCDHLDQLKNGSVGCEIRLNCF